MSILQTRDGFVQSPWIVSRGDETLRRRVVELIQLYWASSGTFFPPFTLCGGAVVREVELQGGQKVAVVSPCLLGPAVTKEGCCANHGDGPCVLFATLEKVTGELLDEKKPSFGAPPMVGSAGATPITGVRKRKSGNTAVIKKQIKKQKLQE